MLTSCALVLFMTPGLAFFYGGMVRSKNVLGMLMKNYVAMGIVTITWVMIGASLAFSGAVSLGDYNVIGNFDLWGLRELGMSNDHFGLPYPDNVQMMFQLMFAIITPALISGAIAERMKFTAWA
ncbi:MAG: ammonia channel protein, partial [Dehalococcoidia bacterium]|nr:ammonia channel protein [Dehalococcoidia bacterium]